MSSKHQSIAALTAAGSRVSARAGATSVPRPAWRARAMLLVVATLGIGACGASARTALSERATTSLTASLTASRRGPNAASRSLRTAARREQSGGGASRRLVRANGGSPRMERLVAAAERIYEHEVAGPRAHRDLRFIAADRAFVADVASGRRRAARREAERQMRGHRALHITRAAVARDRRVIVNATMNANGSFVVAPVARRLTSRGRALGTLLVSVQDVVGYERLLRRELGAYAVVRGGSGQVRSSLRAAANRRLPHEGTVDVGGSRYAVGSFHREGWRGEPLTVWLLVAG